LTYLKLSQKGGKFLTQRRKDAEAQRFFRIKQVSRSFKMFSSRSESTLQRVTFERSAAVWQSAFRVWTLNFSKFLNTFAHLLKSGKFQYF